MVTISKFLKIIVLLLVLCPALLCGQNNFQEKKGLLKVNIGLGQGFLYKHDSKPLFADGIAEYHLSESFSVRGNFHQYITDRTSEKLLQNYSGLTFGGLLHLKPISKRRNDFSVGVQPGISWVNLSPGVTLYDHKASLVPALSLSMNYAFLFSKNCNFYLTVTHQNCFVRGTEKGSVSLSGLMIAGGLGFHIFPEGKTSKSTPSAISE